MDGNITGENDERVGLYVDDNNGVEHWIEMEFDGEIKYHEQDGYSDYPDERTKSENEHVHQARRFAKFHVYREKGYETLPRHENPDCIVGALLALAALPESDIQELFDDLWTQLNSHYDGSSVQLPFDDAEPSDILIYRNDIYITPDPTALSPPLATQYCEYIADSQESIGQLLTEIEDIEQWFVTLLNDREQLTQALPSFEVDAVSELYYLHSDGKTEQTTSANSPLNRKPDARVELPPMDPNVFELYRVLLLSHLSNQVRDRYLMMGQEPPEPFRQQGFGTYRGTIKQQLREMYDKYYLATEQIESWNPS